MKKNDAFRRAAALMAALSITVSLAAPAFAATYYIDNGDITITKNEDGKQTVQQGSNEAVNIGDDEEIIITTRDQPPATQESDLEGLAAEDSGFGPVVEDNYQPAQPEDADQPESADQPENTDQPESADRQEDADQQVSADQQPQPQQAAPAPAAAPAAPTSVNGKGNGVFGNIITVINNAATALKLTLKDVKIDVSDTGKYDRWDGEKGEAALSVQGEGDVEIELDGKNELKSGAYRAGLEKNTSEGTLTLKDDKKDDNKKAGSLTATGGYNGAGIGGGYEKGTNNITITGGTVNAAGGLQAAGIGGGRTGNGKNITINGGTVTATGGGRDEDSDTGGAAGIGGGAYRNGEDITINDGTVTATGGLQAAGIGGGFGRNGKNITITGGTVNATGGEQGAGIGGGQTGNGEDITITGGTVNAAGGYQSAGIGGGGWKGNGEVITINGGTVNAAGGDCGAGIGGGATGSGSNVTVSGAAQVTTIAGKSYGSYGAGATIGNGGNRTEAEYGFTCIDGKEIQADISGVTTGYIHHIIYDQDLILDDNSYAIVRKWWEPVRPDGESRLDLHVETLEGDLLPFDAQQQGGTLRVTTDNLAARLHGTRQALEALREQGVEQIQFVTTLKTTTLSVEDLLAEGGSWFALEHDGLVSRQLSAAQAESLKCWMH